MPRVAAALLLTLVVSFSAGAAGHDVSSVRYAPANLGIGPTRIVANGGRFLTVWAMRDEYPKPNLAYGSLTEPANGQSSVPFLLPGVTGSPSAIMPWGGGFISLWWSGDHFDIVTLFGNGGVEHITHVPRIADPPQFASNGRQLLVVDIQQQIQFRNDSNIITASLYEPDGTLLARTNLPAASVATFDVVHMGDSYVVVTGGDSGDVHFFRLDDAGTIIAERELQGVPPPPQYAWYAPAVAVAGDSDHAVVTWSATQSTAAYVTTVSRSNDVAAPQLLPRNFSRYDGLRLLRTASGHLIIGNDSNGVAVVRTDAPGRVLDAEAIPVANDYGLDDAAADGDQFAAIISTYSTLHPVPLSMVTGTVVPEGVRTSLSPLAPTAAARQEQPVIASDGVDYVAAWIEHSGPDLLAMVGRVTRWGAPLDGPGIALPLHSKIIRNIAITRGAGDDALLVVSTDEGTVAFRWSRTAGLLDTAPIIVDRSTEFGTAVAWNGVSYLVTWVNYPDYSLAGRFVGSDGIAGAKFSIPMKINSFELVEARSPSLAWDGRQFLISFGTAYVVPCSSLCVSPPAEEVRLVRLSATGVPLDKTPYRVLRATSARIATSGSEFLLLTSDYYSFSTSIVHGDAGVLSVSAPTMTVQDARASDATWDGGYYDVAWTGVGDFLRLWRLDRGGHVQQKLFATGPSVTTSIVANDAGEVAIATAEKAPPSNLSRARIYFGSELEPVPAVLPTPTNLVGHLTTNNLAVLHWDGEAPGYLVEWLLHPNVWYEVQHLPANVHEATVSANSGDTFRIRAYGPDGSPPNGPITTVRSEPRTRAARR
ncbi:MAG: hypothetical protein JO093_22310 [Acidobacteria bacterium]|nr:hypothetical protein [Acidobacteriota bacterium]MBV9188359.1 hypothetical protein [Acidobacteriota bacterium]